MALLVVSRQQSAESVRRLQYEFIFGGREVFLFARSVPAISDLKVFVESANALINFSKVKLRCGISGDFEMTVLDYRPRAASRAPIGFGIMDRVDILFRNENSGAMKRYWKIQFALAMRVCSFSRY